MSVIKYAAKFNELSHFSPNQVATKGMKMDYFDQGLKGGIKSMIARHSLHNFQEMYQQTKKIGWVLDEIDKDNKAANLGKGKFEYDNWGPKVGNPKKV